MRVTWPGWCSLDLSEGWTHEDAPDLVSIFNENDGVGALQLAFARRSHRVVPSADAAATVAMSFAAQRDWTLQEEALRLYTLDGSPCAEFECLCSPGESRYWHVWHILDASRLVFATYICEAGDANIEQSERQAIVSSFQWA